MKCSALFFSCFFLVNFAQASCPNELSKSQLLGKVSNPTKFYTPVRDFCSDETLNVFSNCIETGSVDKTLFFGSRERFSSIQKQSDCPNGFATEVKNGFLKFQQFNGKPVCLDSCESIAIGKFFRDEDRFGSRKTLQIGDVVYIPELKGQTCANKTHDGCVTVSQFIEYTNSPVVDLYSGTCTTIIRGLCRDNSDKKLPEVISVYKVNAKPVGTNPSETQLSFDVQDSLLNFY